MRAFFDREVLEMSEEEIIQNWPNLWKTIKEEFDDLPVKDDLEMFRVCKKILALATNVCGTCHDDTSDCQCWNDE